LFALLKAKKRSRKIAEFWNIVAQAVGQEAEATQKLIKNLGSEYQRQTPLLHVSECATEQPQLRGSIDLYNIFDEYYQLYCPHGGSVVPSIILTEKSLLTQ